LESYSNVVNVFRYGTTFVLLAEVTDMIVFLHLRLKLTLTFDIATLISRGTVKIIHNTFKNFKISDVLINHMLFQRTWFV
jgi:hypothetical protein